MFCSNCGQETPNDAKFCKSCGTPLNSQESKSIKNESESVIENQTIHHQQSTAQEETKSKPDSQSDFDDKMLEAFIGKPEKIYFYQNAFQKFETQNAKWHWSWWAFFMQVSFLIHRKIFLYAIIILVAFVIAPMISWVLYGLILLPAWILIGGYSTRLIFDRFKKLKNEITSRDTTEKEKIREMAARGGFVNIWLILVGWILYFILLGIIVAAVSPSEENPFEAALLAPVEVAPAVPERAPYPELATTSGSGYTISGHVLEEGFCDEGIYWQKFKNPDDGTVMTFVGRPVCDVSGIGKKYEITYNTDCSSGSCIHEATSIIPN